MFKKFAIGYLAALAGLWGLGIIVTEILRKWRLLSERVDTAWVVVFFWVLFFGHRYSGASRLQNRSEEKTGSGTFNLIINVLLVVISISAIVSIPFIWYGTIEELAKGAGR